MIQLLINGSDLKGWDEIYHWKNNKILDLMIKEMFGVEDQVSLNAKGVRDLMEYWKDDLELEDITAFDEAIECLHKGQEVMYIRV